MGSGPVSCNTRRRKGLRNPKRGLTPLLLLVVFPEKGTVPFSAGKRVWKARMRFAIGNVLENGRTWLVTSQDGAQQATLDARSGKLIRIDRLKPAKPPAEREVF